MKKTITRRTVERIHREAYAFEELARRFNAAGFISESDTFRRISSDLGAIARRLGESVS